MIPFAANLTLLFTEWPLEERFKRAKEAGFTGIEILFPYEMSAERMALRLRETHLSCALFNIAPGDWGAGDRGLAAQKGREDEFEARAIEAIRYAETVGCVRLHAMAGLAQTADDATFIKNLLHITHLAEPHGIDILIEPINTFDMPGYHLTTTEHARRIIEAVNAPNLGLQFDLYHRHRMQGDVLAAIAANSDLTRHYQIAGPPDRGEPDEGELDLDAVMAAIEGSGYRGWIGCEYRPRKGTLEGLGWYRRFEDDAAG